MSITNINETRTKMQVLKNQQLEFLPEELHGEFIAATENITSDQIMEMSNEEIFNLNASRSDGKVFIPEPDFETENDLGEYLRGVFAFLLQSFEFEVEMDKKMLELEEINKESDRMVKEVYGIDENTDTVELIAKSIEKALEKTLAENDKEKYESILQSRATFNDTFELNRLKELYKTIDTENLKDDAASNRSVAIYRKYLRVQQELGSRYDLTVVGDLEFRFLPKEYHELNNLFVFACMKYISHLMDSGFYNSDDALFASQLTTNLFLLHSGKLNEERKEVLLKNIQEFLDIVK